jgi:hypothetical protein
MTVMTNSDFDFVANLTGETAFYRFPNNGVMFARLPSDIFEQLCKLSTKKLKTVILADIAINYSMRNITKLDIEFDIDQLTQGLSDVLSICDWHPDHRQIGLTHALDADAVGAWYDATGSLVYSWGDDAFDEQGQLKRRTVRRQESQFSNFVPEFNHTIWRTVYDQLSMRYLLGRVRLMQARPKSCLSWHRDDKKRIHIPLVTNLGARLVIQEDAHHLPADGSVYLADTTLYHTAFNAGMEPRIHLVACVLDSVLCQ